MLVSELDWTAARHRNFQTQQAVSSLLVDFRTEGVRNCVFGCDTNQVICCAVVCCVCRTLEQNSKTGDTFVASESMSAQQAVAVDTVSIDRVGDVEAGAEAQEAVVKVSMKQLVVLIRGAVLELQARCEKSVGDGVEAVLVAKGVDYDAYLRNSLRDGHACPGRLEYKNVKFGCMSSQTTRLTRLLRGNLLDVSEMNSLQTMPGVSSQLRPARQSTTILRSSYSNQMVSSGQMERSPVEFVTAPPTSLLRWRSARQGPTF